MSKIKIGVISLLVGLFSLTSCTSFLPNNPTTSSNNDHNSYLWKRDISKEVTAVWGTSYNDFSVQFYDNAQNEHLAILLHVIAGKKFALHVVTDKSGHTPEIKKFDDGWYIDNYELLSAMPFDSYKEDAFQLYLTNHPDYAGSKQDWNNELADFDTFFDNFNVYVKFNNGLDDYKCRMKKGELLDLKNIPNISGLEIDHFEDENHNLINLPITIEKDTTIFAFL